MTEHVARHWTVDDAGLHTPEHVDGPLDVFFGDDRIWSFSTEANAKLRGRGLLVPWPARLRPLLSGVARVRVVGHLDGHTWFDDEVTFGDSSEQLVLRDDAGNPISVDKTGRLQRSFERMADDSRAELIKAARQLVDALVELDVDVYLSYGCLLGAVRDGHMIGHDSDVDLAFLSKHDHPFDIIRESRAIERGIRRLGWQVVRLSAANFKVWVPLPNGKRAGVDVFGSFYVGDHFHLTGNLRGLLPRASMLPFGSIELEGVSFPAPADLDAFLTFTYGPEWRVPDPAFHFDHPEATKARMNQWLRTTRTGIPHWETFFTQGQADQVPREPSSFARWVADRTAPETEIVEIGSGTGRDAIWFAGQGRKVLPNDYCSAARRYATQRAADAQQQVVFRPLNANSQHSLLVRAARLASRPAVKHVYLRDLLGSLETSARPGLWRFCSMVGRRGGHTYLEFTTGGRRPRAERFVPAATVRAEIERAGGRIVTEEATSEGGKALCRMEVTWRQ